MKLAESMIQFKNEKTGKVNTINASELDGLNWQRLGNRPGIKMRFTNGKKMRFGGFKDSVSSSLSECLSGSCYVSFTVIFLMLRIWIKSNSSLRRIGIRM